MTEDPKTTVGSDRILTPISIDMQRLFVAPEKNDTTRIAALLARCIIPVSIGVLNVPRKILHHIDQISQDAETLLPIEAVEVYNMILKLETRMFRPDAKAGIEDAIELFTYDAVKAAPELIAAFTQTVAGFCAEIASIQDQVASQKSFYMSQTLGTDMPVDQTLIVTAAQNLIQSLNVIGSGFKGYMILALVKLIDNVGVLLDNDKLKNFYSVPNRTALMNKLGYRILPGHVAINHQISELMDWILGMEASAQLEKEALIKLFNLANWVDKGLKTLNTRDVVSNASDNHKS